MPVPVGRHAGRVSEIVPAQGIKPASAGIIAGDEGLAIAEMKPGVRSGAFYIEDVEGVCFGAFTGGLYVDARSCH